MRVEFLRVGLGMLLLFGGTSEVRAQDPATAPTETPTPTSTPATDAALFPTPVPTEQPATDQAAPKTDEAKPESDKPGPNMVEKLDSKGAVEIVPIEEKKDEPKEPPKKITTDVSGAAKAIEFKKGAVQPLDVWDLPQPDNGQKTEKKKKKRKKSAFDDIFGPDDDASEDVEIDEYGFEHRPEEDAAVAKVVAEQYSRDMQIARFAKPKTIVLNRDQVKRIRKAQASQRNRGLSFLRHQRENRVPDQRGEPEIKICTVDFGNYGVPKQVQKILRRVKLREIYQKERSLLSTIGKSGCQVVAVQGVIGRSFSSVREAADTFVKKLGPNWEFLIGSTEHKFAYQGFLVDTSAVKIIGTRSHTDKLLPRFGEYQERKFLRAPYELRVFVDGKDGKRGREIILLNFDFHNQLPPEMPEAMTMRMQMSEAMRQLVSSYERELDPQNPSLIVVLGNRNTSYAKASGRILEGRLKLTDFRPKAGCKIKRKLVETEEKVLKGKKWKTVKKTRTDEKMKCKKTVKRSPSYLFGVLSKQLPPPPQVVTIEEPSTDKDGNEIQKKVKKLQYLAGAAKKKWQSIKAARKVDIYLLEPELELAEEKPGVANRFTAGTIPVNNGVKYSPLVWTDLNW